MGNARLDEFKQMRRKINNGIINKFVQEDELPLWLKQGWSRRWYNQEEQNKKNSEGNKKRWANVSRESYHETTGVKISETLKKYHSELTEEEKETKTQKRLHTREQWTQEEKEEYSHKMSESAKKHRAEASPEYWEQSITKAWETRRKNQTFNSSKPEDEMYKQLCEKYRKDDVKRNYDLDERYPYACDFYIVSEDKFIEFQGHWTHGKKPFNPEEKDCQEKLAKWQEKAKNSKFYQTAIYVWTDLDVRKRACAKKNNLNFEVIYP